MRQYHDHSDEEGYRAFLVTDDAETMGDFTDWLDNHSIGWKLDFDGDDLATVWTDWIADKKLASLLKLTWGGQ